MRKRNSIKSLCKSKYVLGLLFVVAAIILYNLMFKTKESFDGKKELVLVHMNGCGHCKKMMPEWNKAKDKNNTGINMRVVEMSEGDGPELCKKHNIQGFPTMILLDNSGKKITSNEERSTNGILDFLKKQVS
tara:strand:- start:277 stop:672 length:396 start_codon:yes stop_codon:yes gene_type:complete